VPLAMILILITPSEGGNIYFANFISKPITAILMSGLFVIISLIIVIVQVIRVYFVKKK
jgi:hypothetical protein